MENVESSAVEFVDKTNKTTMKEIVLAESNALVVSAKSSWAVKYLSKYLKQKYGDGVEIEALSRKDFRNKYEYEPPYKKLHGNVPKQKETESAPLIDKMVDTTFVCQDCGEQVTVSKKPEWATKSKHALNHLKFELKFGCAYCTFACHRPIHLSNHFSVAHNNRKEAQLYPVFIDSESAEKFNECVSICFPETISRSMLSEDVDSSETLPEGTAYYYLELGKPKETILPDSFTQMFNVPSTLKSDAPKRLDCADCDFAASDVKTLADHCLTVHGQKKMSMWNVVKSVDLTPTSQRFICKQCDFSTTVLNDMIVHLQLTACSGYIKCMQCGEHFTSDVLLADHLHSVHPNE